MITQFIHRLRSTEGVESVEPVCNGDVAIYVKDQDSIPTVLAELASTMFEYGYDEDVQITTNKEDLVVYVSPLDDEEENEEWDEEEGEEYDDENEEEED